MIMLRGKIDNQFGALLVAGAVLLVLAIPVRAQEMEVQETDVVDWTGPYLGVNSGLRMDDTKVDYAAIGNFEAVVRHSAVIGGAQFGYNEQLGGRWLIGFEGDAELSNQSASLILGPPSPPNFRCSPPDPQCRFSIFDTLKVTRSIKRSGDASTRLRAGFSWDSVLI